MEGKAEQILNLIHEYINENASWTEKRDTIIEVARKHEAYRMAWEEFIGWFE